MKLNFAKATLHIVNRCLSRTAAIFLLSSVIQSHADLNPPPVNIWGFSVYGANVTHRYVKPFYDDVFQILARPYSVVYGTDLALLQKNCETQQFDIILGSYSRAMQDFERVCKYQVVALTDQDINIYVRSETTPNEVKTLALVQGIRAGDVQMFGNKHIVYYPNHILAVLALYRGDVDGVVSSQAGVSHLLPSLSKKLKIVFTFKEQGHAVALMSSEFFKSEDGRRFRELLLENRASSVAVFVDGMGLGTWRAPKSLNSAPTGL